MLNCQNQRQQRRQQQAYLRIFRQPFGKRMAKEIVETSDGLSTIENLGSRCITPAIRCAPLNQQSTLNSIPKPPSVTHHLDCFVMFKINHLHRISSVFAKLRYLTTFHQLLHYTTKIPLHLFHLSNSNLSCLHI